MDRKEKIIAIIPAFNEEGKIGTVVSRIKKGTANWVDSILVIDDGSQDNTRNEAIGNGAVVISHIRKMGVGSAIRTGIDYALKNQFDIAVVMGGDNQDNPEEIERLIYPVIHNNFDFVQGSRYMSGGKIVNIPLFRLVTTRIYALLLRVLLGFPISDGTNGFRAFRLEIFKNKNINIWQAWLNHYELEPYLLYKVIVSKFNVTEAPVTKTYPCDNTSYTKMIPIFSWWSIMRPLILLKLRIKK